MAVAIESWEQVLGDTDDETAALILKLQIEDTEHETHNNADFRCAKALWARELKHYQAVRAPPAAATAPAASSLLGPTTATRSRPPEQSAITSPTQISAKVVLFDCIICLGRFTADDCWQAPCKHFYCDRCLNDLFRVAMTDEQAYPPRCCTQTVPFEDVERYLDQDLAEDFAAKREELDDPKPTYCHIPTCSRYIGQGFKEGDVAVCLECGAETCIPCKHAVHEGDCEEDQAVKETMRLAESQGWKRCPSCGRIVELRIGCNHITCLCKAEFCYVCRASPWKSCDCSQFHEERLYERGQEIVDRNGGGDVEEVVAGLRENHECVGNNHVYQWTPGQHACEVCNVVLPTFIFRCRHCHVQLCRRCRFQRA